MGKRSGRASEADRLREWLIFVISTETRPRTDHILARWRRWHYLERIRRQVEPIVERITVPTQTIVMSGLTKRSYG